MAATLVSRFFLSGWNWCVCDCECMPAFWFVFAYACVCALVPVCSRACVRACVSVRINVRRYAPHTCAPLQYYDIAPVLPLSTAVRRGRGPASVTDGAVPGLGADGQGAEGLGAGRGAGSTPR
jgi:hypothetical protein